MNLSDLRRNIVYTTHRDGREFLVVFGGGEDSDLMNPIVKWGPLGAASVRVGYMNDDGTEPDMRDAEFAWIPAGLITVSRPLPERVPEQTTAAALVDAGNNRVSVRAVIDRYQESQGWTDAAVLDLLITYLDNQGDTPALDDFLAEAAHDEDQWNDDDGLTDVEADAMTLASAGWGTDEDYGYTGEDY